ncbi:hypothetical protein BDR26DRAFT_721533 [Obelidium mucronatum]|nr:hypothetical protein BDR26DRAFT_721533 [Obelidium mucronatum]
MLLASRTRSLLTVFYLLRLRLFQMRKHWLLTRPLQLHQSLLALLNRTRTMLLEPQFGPSMERLQPSLHTPHHQSVTFSQKPFQTPKLFEKILLGL